MAAERRGLRFILADDLTGAADSSVHFAGASPVRLTFPPGDPWAPGLDPGTVQVHDSETREVPWPAAARSVARAGASLARSWGPRPPVFKKVDSTLRGPVGAELKALLQVLGHRRVVLAPALPSQGRIVLEGRLLVDGHPVGRSVCERLAETGAAAESIPLEVVRAPGLAVRLSHGAGRAPIAVLDAVTDSDLDTIARALEGEPALLPAGSAGMAAALSRRTALAPGAAASVPAPTRVLVVVGSAHERAQEQLRRLLAALPEADVISSPEPGAALAARAGELRSGGWAIVATGGATALAVCRALGVEAIWPRGEILPGVVWSALGGAGEPVLVTKAGGFGGPETLVEAVRHLRAGGDG